MQTYELPIPSAASVKQLLRMLPDDALLDSSLAAQVLRTTQAALEKARRLGRGVPPIQLDRRRVRYRVNDLKRWLRIVASASAGRSSHGDV